MVLVVVVIAVMVVVVMMVVVLMIAVVVMMVTMATSVCVCDESDWHRLWGEANEVQWIRHGKVGYGRVTDPRRQCFAIGKIRVWNRSLLTHDEVGAQRHRGR